MKERIEINKPEEINEPTKRPERKEVKKSKINKWGVYISVIFIVVGLLWYAINIGLIPTEFIREQAGPIIIVLIGLLILIKSLWK
jgi:hypothetical protein